MIILELFSGNGDVSKAFRSRGHKAFRVDWSRKVNAELHADVASLTVDDAITLCGGVPDVVWASPDCTTYSIATHRHRTLKEGLRPKTEYAKECDSTNWAMWQLIDELVKAGTKYYFVENPRGRMRHMPFVQGRPRHGITYCKYGRKSKNSDDVYIMKPTDIFTNHPNPNFLQCFRGEHKHGVFSADTKRSYLHRGEMPQAIYANI